MVRRVVGRVLIDFGYRVAEAGNGREALAWLAGTDSAPALVVTDLIMPEMGGASWRHRWPSDFPPCRCSSPRAIRTTRSFRRRARRGAPSFLQKPLIPETLLRTVRDLLDGA